MRNIGSDNKTYVSHDGFDSNSYYHHAHASYQEYQASSITQGNVEIQTQDLILERISLLRSPEHDKRKLNLNREQINKIIWSYSSFGHAQDGMGNTALHSAVDLEDVSIISKITKNSTRLDAKNHKGMAALDVAFLASKPNLMLAILRNNIVKFSYHGGFYNAIQNFIDCNEMHLPNGYTMLHYACSIGNETLVQMLIMHNAEVKALGYYQTQPIYCAITAQNVTEQVKLSIINELLKNGVEVNTHIHFNETAMHTASRLGLNEIAKLLIKYGSKVEVGIWNVDDPIVQALKNKHYDTVTLLAKHGAKITMQQDINYIFQHFLQDKELQQLFYQLVQIDVKHYSTITDIHLNNVLHYLACAGNLTERIADFIECVSDAHSVDCSNSFKRTPLHAAVVKSSSEIVNLLLKLGANLSFADVDQNTPLHLACKALNVENIKVLLKSMKHYASDKENIAGKLCVDYLFAKPSEEYDSKRIECLTLLWGYPNMRFDIYKSRNVHGLSILEFAQHYAHKTMDGSFLKLITGKRLNDNINQFENVESRTRASTLGKRGRDGNDTEYPEYNYSNKRAKLHCARGTLLSSDPRCATPTPEEDMTYTNQIEGDSNAAYNEDSMFQYFQLGDSSNASVLQRDCEQDIYRI